MNREVKVIDLALLWVCCVAYRVKGRLAVWQSYFLKGYTLVVGVGLFVLGLVGSLGLASYFFIPPPSEIAENVLHIGTGLIFIFAWWLMDELSTIRTFLGSMGALLVLGKILIVGGRTYTLGFLTIDFVGVVCLVVGISSLLVALFVGRAPRAA